MENIVSDFEHTFISMDYSTLKDISSKDYQESSLKLLGFRANDIRKFKYPRYDSITNIEEKNFFIELLFKQSKYSEVKSWALYQLDDIEVFNLTNNISLLISFAQYVENWWHCDQLSSIYFKLLQHQRLFFSTLQSFSKYSSLWHRRLSLTSLFYYAKQNSKPLPFEMGISIVESLLDDEEYYVQKAIGWTLKEMSKLYYKETLEFLQIHIKHIPPVGYTASLEKLTEKDRDELQKIRKRGVSNKYEFKAHENQEINEFDLQTRRYKR